MLWAWNVDIFVRLDLRGWAPPATHYHFNHCPGHKMHEWKDDVTHTWTYGNSTCKTENQFIYTLILPLCPRRQRKPLLAYARTSTESSSRRHCREIVRYNTRCYFNVRSKADISQLNLWNRVVLTQKYENYNSVAKAFSVCQNILPRQDLLVYFPNDWEFITQISHAYCMFIRREIAKFYPIMSNFDKVMPY